MQPQHFLQEEFGPHPWNVGGPLLCVKGSELLPPSQPLTPRLHSSAQRPFSLGAIGLSDGASFLNNPLTQGEPCRNTWGCERPSAFRIPAASKDEGPLCSPQSGQVRWKPVRGRAPDKRSGPCIWVKEGNSRQQPGFSASGNLCIYRIPST